MQQDLPIFGRCVPKCPKDVDALRLKLYKLRMTSQQIALELWDELTEDERREVLDYMKRRTKYGSADMVTMLIAGLIVAVIGLAAMALVGR